MSIIKSFNPSIFQSQLEEIENEYQRKLSKIKEEEKEILDEIKTLTNQEEFENKK